MTNEDIVQFILRLHKANMPDDAEIVLALKDRAEAAEKLCNEALQERDEVWEDKEFQQARADRAEKERDRLRLVLERISNAKPHLKDLVRAALEAKL